MLSLIVGADSAGVTATVLVSLMIVVTVGVLLVLPRKKIEVNPEAWARADQERREAEAQKQSKVPAGGHEWVQEKERQSSTARRDEPNSREQARREAVRRQEMRREEERHRTESDRGRAAGDSGEEQIWQRWERLKAESADLANRQAMDEIMSVLGLRHWPATAAEVKSAYRARLMVMHPDRGGEPRTFQILQAAYGEALRLAEA